MYLVEEHRKNKLFIWLKPLQKQQKKVDLI